MLEESKEDLKRPATVMHQREETRRDIRQFFSVWRLEVALANVEIGWILKMIVTHKLCLLHQRGQTGYHRDRVDNHHALDRDRLEVD